MNDQTLTTNRDSGLMWVLALLTLLLFGFITAMAIRHNPFYSDKESYGISKYQFIESCKEELHKTNDIMLSLQGQPMKLGDILKQPGALRAGEQGVVEIVAPAEQVVSGVQAVNADQAAKPTDPALDLALTAPVMIRARTDDAARTLAQGNMQCLRTKKDGKVQVMVNVTG